MHARRGRHDEHSSIGSGERHVVAAASVHDSERGVVLHETTIVLHQGESFVALATGSATGLQPCSGSRSVDAWTDCAHGIPLPGAHSRPAATEFTLVHDPSQFSGAEKFVVAG